MLSRLPVLALALALCLPGAVFAQDLPAGLRLDASLLPEPGAAEGNVNLLEAALAEGASPQLEALLGIQYLALHRSADTARLCGRAVKSAVSMEPYYCLALAAYYAGDDGAGATWLTKARKMDPTRKETWLLEAYAASRRGDSGAVVAIMEDGQKKTGQDQVFWYWELLRLLDSMNEVEGAFQTAGKLLRLQSELAEPFHRTALLFGKKGDLGSAVKMELAALDREPWHEDAARTLLLFLERDGRLEEALLWASRFLALPQHPQLRAFFLQEQARFHRLMEQRDQQAVCAAHGLTLDERDLEHTDPARVRAFLKDLAQASFQNGRFEQALELIERARKTDPMDNPLRVAQADALLALGRYEEARSFLGRAEQSDPGAYRVQAAAARLEGDPDGCLVAVGRGLAMKPDDRELLWNEAQCLFSVKRDQDALEALERILHIAPADREAQVTRAGWYARRDPKLASGLLWALFLQEPWDFRICLKGAQWASQGKDALGEARWLAACYGVLPPAKATEAQEVLVRLRALDQTSKAVRKADLLAEFCGLHRGLCESRPEASGGAGRKQGPQQAAAQERFGSGSLTYLVETHGAGRFAKLEQRQRLQAWYLVRAVEAADPLLYLLYPRLALPLVTLMEKVVASGVLTRPAQKKAALNYLKLLWANHGPYDAISGEKFLPEGLDARTLLEAMERLEQKGEKLDFLPGKDLPERFSHLEALVFDPSVEPRILVSTGADPVKDSADNFYDPELGVQDLPVEGTVRWPNVRYELDAATLSGKPVPMNAGWKWGARISEVVHFVRQAAGVADDAQQGAALTALADTLESGGVDLSERPKGAALTQQLALLMGFVDSSRDPLHLSGGFQGLVGIPGADTEAFERFRTLFLGAKAAKDAKPLEGMSAQPLFALFDGAPACATGSVPGAFGAAGCTAVFPELLYPSSVFVDKSLDRRLLPEYVLALRTWGRVAGRWMEYARAVFAAGLLAGPKVDGLSGPTGRLVAEVGAQLASLYYMADPRLVEAGAFPAEFHEQVLRVAHVVYYHDCVGTPFLTLPLGGTPRGQAKALICRYMAEGDEADPSPLVYLEAGEGKTARLLNTWKLREREGKLLETIRSALAGDKAARKVVQRLLKDLGTASAPLLSGPRVVHVFAHLEPLLGADGKPLDAKVGTPETLETQRFRLARLRGSLVND
jgi:tetratricopeptide (TPR) repeat protein